MIMLRTAGCLTRPTRMVRRPRPPLQILILLVVLLPRTVLLNHPRRRQFLLQYWEEKVEVEEIVLIPIRRLSVVVVEARLGRRLRLQIFRVHR